MLASGRPLTYDRWECLPVGSCRSPARTTGGPGRPTSGAGLDRVPRRDQPHRHATDRQRPRSHDRVLAAARRTGTDRSQPGGRSGRRGGARHRRRGRRGDRAVGRGDRRCHRRRKPGGPALEPGHERDLAGWSSAPVPWRSAGARSRRPGCSPSSIRSPVLHTRSTWCTPGWTAPTRRGGNGVAPCLADRGETESPGDNLDGHSAPGSRVVTSCGTRCARSTATRSSSATSTS